MYIHAVANSVGSLRSVISRNGVTISGIVFRDARRLSEARVPFLGNPVFPVSGLPGPAL